MGSTRWDASIRLRFRRLAMHGRVLWTQFRTIVDLTAREHLLVSHTRSALLLQRVYRGWRARRAMENSGDVAVEVEAPHRDDATLTSHDHEHDHSDDHSHDHGDMKVWPVDQQGLDGDWTRLDSFGGSGFGGGFGDGDDNDDDDDDASQGVTAPSSRPPPPPPPPRRGKASGNEFSPPRRAVPVSHATVAAGRIQRFMRVATAARKRRRKKKQVKLQQQVHWDNSPAERTRTGSLRLARGGGGGGAHAPALHSPHNHHNKLGAPTTRRRKKKISPTSARHNQNHHKYHQRKDSDLDRVAHRAADWTLKTGFGDMLYVACLRACVRACGRACVRACGRACVRAVVDACCVVVVVVVALVV